MMKIPALSKKQITWVLCAVLAIATAGYFWLRPDPLEVFQKEVSEMLEMANQCRHSELEKAFSPQMVAWLENESVSPRQALAMMRISDENEKRRYRLVHVLVFHPRDYAEAQLQRSEVGGQFSQERNFRVSFIHLDGKWKITPCNKLGERTLEFPE